MRLKKKHMGDLRILGLSTELVIVPQRLGTVNGGWSTTHVNREYYGDDGHHIRTAGR
jgi:hypothetical protein